ncbi:hypothetical protein [Reyranella sp.]|uniref:hypothetical protein n=1 Tax=Reyranella sp. TaxID=1929291 RepID=UPI00378526A5
MLLDALHPVVQSVQADLLLGIALSSRSMFGAHACQRRVDAAETLTMFAFEPSGLSASEMQVLIGSLDKVYRGARSL